MNGSTQYLLKDSYLETIEKVLGTDYNQDTASKEEAPSRAGRWHQWKEWQTALRAPKQRRGGDSSTSQDFQRVCDRNRGYRPAAIRRRKVSIIFGRLSGTKRRKVQRGQ